MGVRCHECAAGCTHTCMHSQADKPVLPPVHLLFADACSLPPFCQITPPKKALRIKLILAASAQAGLNAGDVEAEEGAWSEIIEKYSGLDRPWVPDVVGRAWGNRGNARSRQVWVLGFRVWLKV